MTFAVTLPALGIAMSAGIEYSRAISFREQLQAAADAAATGATAAMVQGQSASDAQAVGLALFTANAPSGALPSSSPGSDGVVSIQPTNYAATLTTVVNYTGSMKTVFAGLLNLNLIPMSITAEAQAVTSATSGAGTYSGIGTMWGDPYIMGADGTFRDLFCNNLPPGSWYNAVSDRKFEVNIQCSGAVVFNSSWFVVSAFSIMVDNHVISFSAPQPTNVNGTLNFQPVWEGAVTIDGVTYPPSLGHHSYLNGLVQTDITDLNDFYQYANSVTVTTPTYVFKGDFGYQSVVAGRLSLTATNAGACGVPGGILGTTLAGIFNDNLYYGQDDGPSKYLVSGPTAVSNEFNWVQCNMAGGTSLVHLVK